MAVLGFESISHYVKEVLTWGQNGLGMAGVFVNQPSFEAVSTKFFDGGNGLTVAQNHHKLYQLELQRDPDTKDWNFKLDRFCKQALLSLPPSYDSDENKIIYARFIKYWGTAFAATTMDGGVMEDLTKFNTDIMHSPVGPGSKPFNIKQIETEAKNDFIQVTTGQKMPHTASWTSHAKKCRKLL
eukprot:TRINITY_DN4886_c0_g1_i1.p1 TRINITY_DN4886_c0_g1~~TRINITY_DN4886_c0_g1_i1.p1  ORF type:complete len:198 (-),score=41.13 TRINITY_DN4886_c0_g1_i1:54-605(-)